MERQAAVTEWADVMTVQDQLRPMPPVFFFQE